MEHRIDPWLILAVVGILAASLATLHAAGPVRGSGLLLRQALWGASGLLLVWALSLPNLSFYSQFAPFACAASMAGLGLVLLLGEDRGGNRAWFALGPLTVQPSEFARVGVILMVAAWLGRSRSQRLSLQGGLIVAAMVGAQGTCPPGPDTRHSLKRSVLSHVKPGAVPAASRHLACLSLSSSSRSFGCRRCEGASQASASYDRRDRWVARVAMPPKEEE